MEPVSSFQVLKWRGGKVVNGFNIVEKRAKQKSRFFNKWLSNAGDLLYKFDGELYNFFMIVIMWRLDLRNISTFQKTKYVVLKKKKRFENIF